MARRLRSFSYAAALLAAPAALTAQTVQGRLVAGRVEAPVGGALVQLLDSAGVVVGRAASSPSGGFSVRAPRAGTYHVLVR